MNSPTLFVSYSHKDEPWKDLLVSHLEVLGQKIDLWDDRRIIAGEDWSHGIEKAVEKASAAVLLVSASFLASKFITDVELPSLYKHWQREQIRVFPLIIRPCAWQWHPWIAKFQVWPPDGQPLSSGTSRQVEIELSTLAEVLGQARLPSVSRGLARHPSHPSTVSLARLPTTSSQFLGRDEELARLNTAWADPHTHILSIIAPGGVGKTALVNTWLGQMAAEDYRGARHVFGWSFYSQGAGESEAASGDSFLAEALRFFGDPEPAADASWQRGERLAQLIREEKTILVLDGLEPLQEPPRTGLPTGRLKDPGLQALLRNLAASNSGLCLITTREKVEDLDYMVGTTVVRLELNELPPEAGAAMLRAYNVKGRWDELEQVSEEFGGHALALTLLGTYLRDVCDGDIRGWKEVPLLEEAAEKGGYAIRVMKSYEKWLGEGPELSVLYLLGLFDRPASKEEMEALLSEPVIPGLTEELVKGGQVGWKRAIRRLREGRLVSGDVELGQEGSLDAHPLVRTYFAARLESEHPAAFHAGHLRLYEHLKQAAPYQPNTLEEMRPLFHAVIHGCRGGQVQQAMDEVFYPRVRRQGEHYSVHKLGAIGADLAALSGFFEHPWDRPEVGLPEAAKSFVLNAAGFGLRAQGRLAEAVAPLRSAIDVTVSSRDWKNASIYAGNLSELLLALGRVEEAVSASNESVELADRSGAAFMRMVNRTTLADALHQGGQVDEARSLFEEAERMQAELQPHYPLLYSLQGYRYCDLLLALTLERDMGGEVLEAIRQRAEQTLEWVSTEAWLLDIALDHLTLGRTHLHLALAAQPDSTHLAQAIDHLDRAVDGLRQSGTMHNLPLGLLARATFWRWADQPDKATADLNEAFEIAERGGMRLHLTDAHLERARVRVHLGEIDGARADVEESRQLVEETGYHRRDSEVTAVAATLE